MAQSYVVEDNLLEGGACPCLSNWDECITTPTPCSWTDPDAPESPQPSGLVHVAPPVYNCELPPQSPSDEEPSLVPPTYGSTPSGAPTSGSSPAADPLNSSESS